MDTDRGRYLLIIFLHLECIKGTGYGNDSMVGKNVSILPTFVCYPAPIAGAAVFEHRGTVFSQRGFIAADVL